jgi:hypothetical protein
MRRRLVHSLRRAVLIIAVLIIAVLVGAPTGVGCQPMGCDAAGDTVDQANKDQTGEDQAGQDRAGKNPTRDVARQRALSFIELVEYEPASMATSTALSILSYPQAEDSLSRRSYIYDQALALLWFAWTGQRHIAHGLAETLIYLQKDDGSWGFSVDTSQPNAYHASYVRSGAVAWAAHALGYFAVRFAKPRALRAASRGADFLRRMRLGGSGLGRGLVSAGYGTPSSPPGASTASSLSYAVTEHQFDAHMVLSQWEPKSARRLVERVLEVLWMDQEGRFAVAAVDDRLNPRRALDAAGAWGALWLWSIGEADQAQRSYLYALEHFQTGAPGGGNPTLFGFRPYVDAVDGYDPRHARDHIFVEGTMGMGLAAHRLGDDRTAQKVLATGVELSCRGAPGLAYSNVEVPGFSTRPAAASTLWFLFLEREMATDQVAPLFDSTVIDRAG